MDKQTLAALDQKISQMTYEEQQQLSTKGGRILKGSDSDEGKTKNREYMRRYKMRVALATKLGLIQGKNLDIR